jgi:5-oxoprolinase (ATP-hydrolysing) subunit B
MPFGTPNCARLGESALAFFTNDDSPLAQRRLWSLARIAKTWSHVRESVPADGNLTLIFDPRSLAFERLASALEDAWNLAADAARQARTIEIPVRYGGENGPDLAYVAQRCGLAAEAVVELHRSAQYVVAFLGFVPGFAYLDGLDARLQLSRRDSPRARVPAGSVAIAGSKSAVYPLDSPGGWHVIGRTDLRMFDPQREPFTRLEPGDRVRFVAA